MRLLCVSTQDVHEQPLGQPPEHPGPPPSPPRGPTPQGAHSHQHWRRTRRPARAALRPCPHGSERRAIELLARPPLAQRPAGSLRGARRRGAAGAHLPGLEGPVGQLERHGGRCTVSGAARMCGRATRTNREKKKKKKKQERHVAAEFDGGEVQFGGPARWVRRARRAVRGALWATVAADPGLMHGYNLVFSGKKHCLWWAFS